jgi:hypothetical protein
VYVWAVAKKAAVKVQQARSGRGGSVIEQWTNPEYKR